MREFFGMHASVKYECVRSHTPGEWNVSECNRCGHTNAINAMRTQKPCATCHWQPSTFHVAENYYLFISPVDWLPKRFVISARDEIHRAKTEFIWFNSLFSGLRPLFDAARTSVRFTSSTGTILFHVVIVAEWRWQRQRWCARCGVYLLIVFSVRCIDFHSVYLFDLTHCTLLTICAYTRRT